MELTNSQIERLKEIEMQMFSAFIEVCEKLGLQYYVLGGTLLGAVRHEGFIPWDDDIDVGMPRQDYIVFTQKAQKLLPDYYFVQNIETDCGYIYNFTKIRDSRTTFIETALKDRSINHGVFIDIFPLDVFTDDEKTVKKFNLKNRFYSERIRGEIYGDKLPLKTALIKALLKLIYPSLQDVLKKKEALLQSVEEGAYWANHCGAWGAKEIIPAHWYGKGVLLDFEGIKVYAPEHYEKWLTQVYGNYMQLPPVEKRVTHHYTEVIDLDKPYIEYMKRD